VQTGSAQRGVFAVVGSKLSGDKQCKSFASLRVCTPSGLYVKRLAKPSQKTPILHFTPHANAIECRFVFQQVASHVFISP
jgi:hypothetical protein